MHILICVYIFLQECYPTIHLYPKTELPHYPPCTPAATMKTAQNCITNTGGKVNEFDEIYGQ